MFHGSLGATGLRRAALGATIAGLGTCAYGSFGWWSVRSGVLSPDGSARTLIGVLIAILILIAIGATAGLVSGRFRDAPASWAAAVIGGMLAYQINYTIDPSWPTSEDGLWGSVLYAAVFLLPFIAGGHLLGARARVAAPEGKANRILIVGALFAILAGVTVSAAIALNSSMYSDGYRPASTADIAAAFNVTSLPTQLGGFQLDNTSTYDSGPTTGRAYYAIWRDQAGRQIQVVLNTRVPSAGSPYGFTDDGGQVTFRVSEGDTWLQVFAPDLPSLRAAVAAVRPGLTAQLDQEIAHPTTPQPKEAPTE